MVSKLAQELGRRGGQVRSEAKRLAAINNGQLGGRPWLILAEDLDLLHQGTVPKGSRVRNIKPHRTKFGPGWRFQLFWNDSWQWKMSRSEPVISRD